MLVSALLNVSECRDDPGDAVLMSVKMVGGLFIEGAETAVCVSALGAMSITLVAIPSGVRSEHFGANPPLPVILTLG